MTEVEYSPVKTVKIHEILYYSLDEFVKNICMFSQHGAVLKWCDGILFTSELMPYTPDIIDDRIAGILHWNYIEFAIMPEFTPTILSEDKKKMITVVDVSMNTTIADVCRWLKKQPQWQEHQKQVQT